MKWLNAVNLDNVWWAHSLFCARNYLVYSFWLGYLLPALINTLVHYKIIGLTWFFLFLFGVLNLCFTLVRYLQQKSPTDRRRSDCHFFNTYFYNKLKEAVLKKVPLPIGVFPNPFFILQVQILIPIHDSVNFVKRSLISSR